MTTSNALGFFFMGLLMLVLPSALPAWFPPTGHVGSSTSAIWLGLMGGVNDSIGAWFLARNELVPVAVRVLAWRPQPLPEFAPATILRPAVAFSPALRLVRNDDRRAAA